MMNSMGKRQPSAQGHPMAKDQQNEKEGQEENGPGVKTRKASQRGESGLEKATLGPAQYQQQLCKVKI